MAAKGTAKDFQEGKDRLDEIRRRLGTLFGKGDPAKAEEAPLSGFLGGLGTLIDQLGKLAERAEQEGGTLSRSGEVNLGGEKGVRGVYGFSVRTGLGREGVKVEPFGNIRKDAQSGRVVVKEVREPLVDLFDEPDHVLVVAEMPGIRQEDVRLELHGDILTIAAERGDKRYRKELLLPVSPRSEGLRSVCHNGILEVTLAK